MTGSFFVAGGYQWAAMPPLALLPWGRGRHLLTYVHEQVLGDGQAIEVFNRDVALALGKSVRWVQLALRELRERGFLASKVLEEVDAAGRKLWRRVLTVLLRPAGRKDKPKSKSGPKLGPPLLGTPGANSCAGGAQDISPSPSFEGNHNSGFTAAVADAGHGSPSSPAAEGKDLGAPPPPRVNWNPPAPREEDLPPAPQELPGIIEDARQETVAGRAVRAWLRGWVKRGVLPASQVPAEWLVEDAPIEETSPRVKPSEGQARAAFEVLAARVAAAKAANDPPGVGSPAEIADPPA